MFAPCGWAVFTLYLIAELMNVVLVPAGYDATLDELDTPPQSQVANGMSKVITSERPIVPVKVTVRLYICPSTPPETMKSRYIPAWLYADDETASGGLLPTSTL